MKRAQQAADLETIPPNICTSDLLVFSHLRWDFVFQRPQHLMSRFAENRRVYFIEEPKFSNFDFSYLHYSERPNSLKVICPHLPKGLTEQETTKELMALVNELIEEEMISDYTAWYYTPMALPFTQHLNPQLIIYDCMDELSAFKNAPTELRDFEKELLRMADVVFTGGVSLYEAKKHLHNNIHAFPSSIDVPHFATARTIKVDPADQKEIPHPRLGFFGVIDERMDIKLIDGIASLRPDWHLVMIGPVVKIDPNTLPKRANIHYLGMKDYKDLPAYLSGWDLAMLPFAQNESTKFISPTKTPEYLAAGKPVVSTSIRDVVRPYGKEKLVYIADTPEDFVKSAEMAMKEAQEDPSWLKRVDQFLSQLSWVNTCQQMASLENTSRGFRSKLKSFTASQGFAAQVGI